MLTYSQVVKGRYVNRQLGRKLDSKWWKVDMLIDRIRQKGRDVNIDRQI